MEKLLIGKILKPQGIKGEIKVQLYTDDAQNFKKIKNIYLSERYNEVEVLNVRISNDSVFLTLEGLVDRNQAELMRGLNIYVNREDLPKPQEGLYYICDILGSCVFDEEDNLIGEVVDILTECGGADVYVLKNGKRQVLFPFLDKVVVDVNVEDKKIIIDKSEFDGVAVYED